MVNHDNFRTAWACLGGAPVGKLLYQLVGNVLDSQGFDGYGESGFDSGEWAWETADTSKEGSRRENYPMRKPWGSDKKYERQCCYSTAYSNEAKLKLSPRTKWRASLVPAAAVTPAPRVYLYVAVVKKLVVGFQYCLRCRLTKCRAVAAALTFCAFRTCAIKFVQRADVHVHFEEILKLKLAVRLLSQAWDDGRRLCLAFVGFARWVMINRSGWGTLYWEWSGEMLGSFQDKLMRRLCSKTPPLIKSESASIEDDQIPS